MTTNDLSTLGPRQGNKKGKEPGKKASRRIDTSCFIEKEVVSLKKGCPLLRERKKKGAGAPTKGHGRRCSQQFSLVSPWSEKQSRAVL